MASIAAKIGAAFRNTKTYQLGLIQAKAYRILKQETGAALAPVDISTTEWAFLGLLYDKKEGIRAIAAADELGVEASFVTVMLQKLSKPGFIESDTDPNDSRAKQLLLTKAGRVFVEETEGMVRTALRPLVHGAKINDIATYAAVLELIIQNEPKV